METICPSVEAPVVKSAQLMWKIQLHKINTTQYSAQCSVVESCAVVLCCVVKSRAFLCYSVNSSAVIYNIVQFCEVICSYV